MPNCRPKKKAKQPVASGAAGMITTTTSNTGSVSMHASDSTNIAPMQVDSTTEGNAAAAVAAMSTSTALKIAMCLQQPAPCPRKKRATRKQAVKNKLGENAPPELSKPSLFGAYKQYVPNVCVEGGRSPHFITHTLGASRYVPNVVTKICDQGLAASPKPPPAGVVEQRAQDPEYRKSLATQGRRPDYIRARLGGAAEALQRTVHIASLAVNAYIAEAFEQVNLDNIGKHLEPTEQTEQTDPFVLGSHEIRSLLRLCPRSPSLQVLKGKSFVHTFYEEHLKHRLDPLRAELADHQGLSKMLDYIAITMATNLRVMTSTTFSSRIRAWVRARLNALVSHYLGHLAIVTIYPTRKARDASVEQVVSHAMGWIGPRFLDKKAPFREISDATRTTFSAYMDTRFRIKDARFKDSSAPIDWKSVWAALNSKVLDYFVPIHAFERIVAEKQRDRPKNDEASKKTYLNDDWVASRRLMILRAVLRDVEVLETEIQNKFRSENPGTRQQPPQLKKWALAPVAGYVPGSFRFPDETLQIFANEYSSSRRNEVKLKFDDFFSPNLFVKHGETLKTTRRLVIKRFLVSDGISTSIMSEYVPRDPENGPKKAAILEHHDDPDNIFNAPDLQQLLDRNIRFLCTIDFNRKNYLVLRIAPLDESSEYTKVKPTSKRGRKLVRDGVIFLKISKKEYKQVRCISRYNRIREQLEDQERCQRKLHRQMDIFADPPSIKGTSVQLVWNRIAFLAETDTTQADTTQADTTQADTTQPNARKPNAQETKATSSESAGKGCRFGMLMQFYARHVFRRLRMESFSAKQKWPTHMQDRIYDTIQRLRPDWKVRNPRKCRDQDNPRILFAVGDGNFKHNSAGHITMPTATPLFESFRALGEAVYWVDEYNTSKCCSRCGLEMEQGLKHKNAQPLASAAAAQKERKASKIIKRRAKELLKYARNRIRQNEKRIEQLLQTRPILPQRPISREVAECAIQFALVDVARQHKGSKDKYRAPLDFASRLQASLDAALQSAAQDATAPPERLVRKRQSPRVGADRRLSCFPPQSLQQGTDPLVASNYNAKDLISPWGLRYCPGCNILWCRDKNAVINMALRVLFYLNQPQQFDEEGKPMPKQDGPPHLRLIIDTGEGVDEYEKLLSDTLRELGVTHIAGVLCTHWHHDHVGGIAQVQRIAASLGQDPASLPVHKHARSADAGYSARSADPESASAAPNVFDFLPIADGQIFAVQGATLTAIHSPGHTTDHTCFFLAEDRSLFTGDCVLGQGSAVFEDLATILATLRKLAAHVPQPLTLYCGHGPVVATGAVDKINEYIAHRIERETQILAVMASVPEQPNAAAQDAHDAHDASPVWTIEAIAAHIYKGYPREILPAAQHSVAQHLRKLLKDGVAERIISGSSSSSGGGVGSDTDAQSAWRLTGRSAQSV
ncbi:hypothetical protein HK105_205091 [Polyrhizophydium stewartii]|uniref:Metallo-beta-lactamase domain-containing protein n=1 Tax=Polyrhizophydium stewartii TaxID=2732419 RepID=A0ABR4N7G0_9FUNG